MANTITTTTTASIITTTTTTRIITTTTTTSIPTPSTSTSSQGNGHTGEGLPTDVGIGIGCALGGALLAGLIVFLLSRRKYRQPSYQKQQLPPNGGAYVRHEKRDVAATRGPVTNVDRLLPQPAEDDVVMGGLSKIRDGIKNHVQNYYHNAPVDPRMVDEATLVELARVMAIPTSGILDLLLNAATRMPMIRLFLAHLILSRCTGQTDGTESFLPNEVSALANFHIEAHDTAGKSGPSNTSHDRSNN
jgi:hypothetical protein